MSTGRKPGVRGHHARPRDPLCWAGDHAYLLLRCLRDVRRCAKHQWVARCPAHVEPGPTRALAVAEGFEELLIGCRGGCSLDEVLAAVGLSGNELGLEPVARADGNLHGGPGSSDGAELPATPVEVIP